MDFNDKHPERKSGEMFLCNTSAKGYVDIGWSSKRMGKQSYLSSGELFNGLYPVFIKKLEYMSSKNDW